MTNTLYDTLFAPHRESTAPFLISPDKEVTTYATFLDLAARLATRLASYGLEPGARVVAQTEKCEAALALYVACLQSGLIYLPLNTAYTPDEVAYFVEDSGASLFVAGSEAADDLSALATKLGARFETLDPKGGSLIEKLETLNPRTEVTARGPHDIAALLYTSGTTGRSKGAMLTHLNLLSNAEALVEIWQFTSADRLIHALPIFHTHGLFVATNVIALAGAAMHFQPQFAPDDVFAALPDATAMMGVPTFYTRLLADPRLSRESAGHMRVFISGSAPLLAETHRAFAARTGHAILERYGMTETSMITSNPFAGPRLAGTVGFPLPGVEVRITSPETGTTLADGEIGMIEMRGPNVFKGYWNMPEKTAAEMRADGFFITGDLGLIDAKAGHLTIVGRGKDLIIAGGYNIYPKEIELVIDALSDVVESAVIGVPHPDLGEAVVAVVVREPGIALTADAILAAIAPSLARFKQPRHVAFAESLPRNTMGKVQKAALRTAFAEVFTKER